MVDLGRGSARTVDMVFRQSRSLNTDQQQSSPTGVLVLNRNA